ncbi:hypothetical protein Q8A67_019732 [Cirrhinus molitorella]|uniref:Uncharacterized protein n=1 Tax=Cirrhinus molitorella TaxID=172907 RepID=A0AA88PM48_9TELE|nr:hypothetical protein Q8A67_019732 [Cirrhinus molitorella]
MGGGVLLQQPAHVLAPCWVDCSLADGACFYRDQHQKIQGAYFNTCPGALSVLSPLPVHQRPPLEWPSLSLGPMPKTSEHALSPLWSSGLMYPLGPDALSRKRLSILRNCTDLTNLGRCAKCLLLKGHVPLAFDKSVPSRLALVPPTLRLPSPSAGPGPLAFGGSERPSSAHNHIIMSFPTASSARICKERAKEREAGWRAPLLPLQHDREPGERRHICHRINFPLPGTWVSGAAPVCCTYTLMTSDRIQKLPIVG